MFPQVLRNVRVSDKRVWQSYTDLIPSEVYDGLKEVCPGELTTIDEAETVRAANAVVRRYLNR